MFVFMRAQQTRARTPPRLIADKGVTKENRRERGNVGQSDWVQRCHAHCSPALPLLSRTSDLPTRYELRS